MGDDRFWGGAVLPLFRFGVPLASTVPPLGLPLSPPWDALLHPVPPPAPGTPSRPPVVPLDARRHPVYLHTPPVPAPLVPSSRFLLATVSPEAALVPPRLLQQSHGLRIGAKGAEGLPQLTDIFPVRYLTTLILDSVSISPEGLTRFNVGLLERNAMLLKYSTEIRHSLECIPNLTSLTVWDLVYPRSPRYNGRAQNNGIPRDHLRFDSAIMIAFIPTTIVELTIRLGELQLGGDHWGQLTQLRRLTIFGESLNYPDLAQNRFAADLSHFASMRLEDVGVAFPGLPSPSLPTHRRDRMIALRNLEFIFGLPRRFIARNHHITRLRLWMPAGTEFPTLEELDPILPHLQNLYLNLSSNLPRGQFYEAKKAARATVEDPEDPDERVGFKTERPGGIAGAPEVREGRPGRAGEEVCMGGRVRGVPKAEPIY